MFLSSKLSLSLNGNMLKVLACCAMLFDHIGYAFIQEQSNGLYIWFCLIFGRIAFPVFAFLLAEGLYYTSNKKNYVLKMCLFAFISEIPFDMMSYGTIFELTHQNIYFSLALGLISCISVEKIEKWVSNRHVLMIFLEFFCIATFATIAHICRFDYGAYGVVAIYMCCIFRNKPSVAGFAESAVLLGLSVGELAASFSSCLLLFYNGERGKKNLKYIFYWFYPVHLLVIGFIRIFIANG